MPKKGETQPAREGLMTRDEIAGHFSVHKGTITRWEHDGCPVAKRAGRGNPSLFDPVAVKAWKDEKDAEGSGEFLSLEKMRARLASAQAEKVERENRVRAGELIEIDEMLAIGQTFVKAMAAKIRALPRRLVQVGAVSRTQEAAAHTLCRELLTEISEWRTLKDLEKVAGEPAPKGKRQKLEATA